MRVTLIGILVLTFFSMRSQSIVGTWQLVEKTSCLDDDVQDEDEEIAELIEEMKSMSGGTNRVIVFKDNLSGEENVKIFESRKAHKMNNFLYKIDGNNLYILDKKSRLLVGSYEVERLSTDSLVFSHMKRPCETRIFVRVRDSK